MQFITVLLAVMATTSIALPSALDAGEQTKSPSDWESACFDEDGPCHDLQQAAAVLKDSFIADQDGSSALNDISCYAKGAPCNLAKREALAMAEAVAEAYSMVMPQNAEELQSRSTPSAIDDATQPPHPFCGAEGSPCSIGASDLQQWCGSHGEICTADAIKVKRAADTLAKTVDAYGSMEKRRLRWKMKWCHGVGEPCIKVKRAFEHLDAFVKAS